MNNWKMRDGTEISVKDMETSHIKNCLNMLEREGFISESTLGCYLTSSPNGEMASYYFEQEQAEVFSKPVSVFIDVFEEELKSRKSNNLP